MLVFFVRLWNYHGIIKSNGKTGSIRIIFIKNSIHSHWKGAFDLENEYFRMNCARHFGEIEENRNGKPKIWIKHGWIIFCFFAILFERKFSFFPQFYHRLRQVHCPLPFELRKNFLDGFERFEFKGRAKSVTFTDSDATHQFSIDFQGNFVY